MFGVTLADLGTAGGDLLEGKSSQAELVIGQSFCSAALFIRAAASPIEVLKSIVIPVEVVSLIAGSAEIGVDLREEDNGVNCPSCSIR